MNNIKPQNHLVWSPSRHRTLLQCEKRYYYQYVGSWGGWERWASQEAQLSYGIKRRPEFEADHLVKQAIRTILTQAVRGEQKSMREQVKGALDAFVKYVYSGKNRRFTKNKRKYNNNKMGTPLAKEAIHALLGHMGEVLKAFYKSPTAKYLLENPSVILSDFLEQDEFEVVHELGVPARIRPDAVWTNDGDMIIGVWKMGLAGQNDRHRAQILAAYVRAVQKIPYDEAVRVIVTCLPSGMTTTYRFDGEEAEILRTQISEEFDLIRKFSDDPQINTAPKSRFRPHFSSECNRCPFRRICDDFSKFSAITSNFAGGGR